MLTATSVDLIIDGSTCTSGITDASIQDATKLVMLNVENNPNITSIAPFVVSLRELNIGAIMHFGIGDAQLVEATGLRKLDISDNKNVTSLTPFAATLRELVAEGNCAMGDEALQEATSLVKLSVSGNSQVTTIVPFAQSLCVLTADTGSPICSEWERLQAVNREERMEKEPELLRRRCSVM